MERHLTWTKGLFESTYQVFENGQIKNSLFFETWKNEARSIGQSETIFFKTTGFLESTTLIVNEKAAVLGTITFTFLQTKANVILTDGTHYSCDFSNNWLSKWMVTDSKAKQIIYDSNTSSGNINTNTDDELMLLTGLFFREYYGRTIMLFIVFLFIFTIVIT
jgi:hypothetical protein